MLFIRVMASLEDVVVTQCRRVVFVLIREILPIKKKMNLVGGKNLYKRIEPTPGM